MAGIGFNQLEECARDYASVLPGWRFYKDNFWYGLWRSCGPLRQNIWFGALGDGDYRLSHDITIFVPSLETAGDESPWVRMLPYFLGEARGSRLQSLSPKQHSARWRDALAAMEREFRPEIRKPLDLGEIAALCREDDVPHETAQQLKVFNAGRVNVHGFMAVLEAWMGERDGASQRCVRLQALPNSPFPEMFGWDREMKAFSLDLLRALEAGREREFLQPIADYAASATGD